MGPLAKWASGEAAGGLVGGIVGGIIAGPPGAFIGGTGFALLGGTRTQALLRKKADSKELAAVAGLFSIVCDIIPSDAAPDHERQLATIVVHRAFVVPTSWIGSQSVYDAWRHVEHGSPGLS